MNRKNSAQLLRFFFEEKKKRMAGYSMRALARDLDFSQSYVSEVLAGKKRLKAEHLDRWARVLKIDELGKKKVQEALFLEFSRSERKADSTGHEREEWMLNTPDDQLLRRWFHVVILELINTDHFTFDPALIARKVGVPIADVQSTLSLLEDLGYVQVKNGTYQKTKKKLRFPTSKSMANIRNFHRQMIELSLHELKTKTDPTSFERRLITGITVSANPAQIVRARARLLEAIHEVAEILMEGPCTDVIQLNTQLFSHLQSIAR